MHAALLFFWIRLITSTVPNSIVLDQPPLNTGGPGSDTAFLNGKQPVWQQVADDVMLSHNTVLNRIDFFGFYGGQFASEIEPPPVNEVIRVRFYDNRPENLPGAVLYEESYLNPLRIPTGRFIQAGPHPPEMRYQLDLVREFELQANVPYWLEIVQVGDLNSHFRWEASPGNGTPYAFLNSIVPDWRRTISGNVAFQLHSVPEPSTFLSGVAIISFFVLKRRNVRR